MRKLIVLTFLTLDGVMQAPGGQKEDTTGGFEYGGWSFPYFDPFMGETMGEQMGHDFDLLLGRKTFQIFAGFWPNADPVEEPVAVGLNKAKKYVASRSSLTMEWENSIRIDGDLAEGVRKLKSEDGPELQVHGSGNMIQTLLKHDLVDELWLKIFPVTIGNGKRLFAEGSIPKSFELTKCAASPQGVIIANYRRGGEIKTGSF
ncbi:MAG TPA: dihydrofolate reductase family protein [Candidatus Kapabacteria bacterium]|nr:dihydrofolate reductase family protein [Candidatus Kapabacteria bacterium]